MYLYEIASRFRRSKKQDNFISFVSASSTTGIALGCAVLIILLSVMNGFEKELRVTFLKMIPHAEIFAFDNSGIEIEQDFISLVKRDERVAEVYTLNKAIGLLQSGSKMKSLSITGMSQTYVKNKFSSKSASMNGLFDTPNGIVLGSKIIDSLKLEVGQEVQILLPSGSSMNFAAPRSTWVTIVGEVSVGGDLDKQIALVNNELLNDILELKDRVTHIELELHDPFNAREVVREYGYQFDQAAYMSDWTRTNGHLYQDIQLIRTLVYIVLGLVICVASFNIVSSLMMSVKERSKEIAILKTLGTSNAGIASIFIYKGLYHAIKGSIIGVTLGCVLAIFLADIFELIEHIFNVSILSSEMYFTSSIPSQLMFKDVFVTLVLVMMISVLATLYPARQAAKLQPAQQLY